jgi:hypothetical protein
VLTTDLPRAEIRRTRISAEEWKAGQKGAQALRPVDR